MSERSRNRCPHCGLPALPAWRKLALGPTARARCRRCGLAVGVAPGRALVALLPCLAVVAAVTLGWIARPPAMVAAGLAAIGATALLHLAWVPLVRRGLTDAQAVRAAHARWGAP